MTPGPGAVCGEIKRSLEVAFRRLTEHNPCECVFIVLADYIPISA